MTINPLSAQQPFTTKDVVLRLEAVTLKPRDWIEGVAYIGPDRRRFNSADYSGARKRHADKEAPTETSRLLQALRILKAAIGAIFASMRIKAVAQLGKSSWMRFSSHH